MLFVYSNRQLSSDELIGFERSSIRAEGAGRRVGAAHSGAKVAGSSGVEGKMATNGVPVQDYRTRVIVTTCYLSCNVQFYRSP